MKKFLVAAVIAFCVTAVILCCAFYFGNRNQTLVVCNSETDDVIMTFPVCEGDEFSVEFIHSVNQSPVKDVFVIRDEKIFVDRTVYSAFGAGVQTEVEEWQILEYDDDGNMIVSGFNIEFPKVKYIVGTVSDHILEIGGKTISLRDTCGRNAHIYFELR